MNPDKQAISLNLMKDNKYYITFKNKEIKKRNRDVRMRNFIRRK